ASLPSGTAVVACSDHGFGTLRADVFLDVALAEAGLVDAPAGAGLLGRIGRSAIGQRLPTALRRAARGATAGGRGPVWTATPYECGVRLTDEALTDDVVGVLRGLRDPDGVALVSAVHRRADLYAGPHVERAPDLLVELADESVDLHDGFHAPSPWVSRASVPWGTHRADGVIAVQGAPGLPAERRWQLAKGEAQDVAPTVLDLLGLRVDGLDGTSLVAATTEHRTVTADASATDAAVYTDEEESAVLEHLRGLGYVD
ncbi:MAG TPA: hypothetical protein VFB78_04785, partial [Acidimicrobiales bacterium]|nr:hypothetical protein [Acidimicrobiales bacterium]